MRPSFFERESQVCAIAERFRGRDEAGYDFSADGVPQYSCHPFHFYLTLVLIGDVLKRAAGAGAEVRAFG